MEESFHLQLFGTKIKTGVHSEPWVVWEVRHSCLGWIQFPTFLWVEVIVLLILVQVKSKTLSFPDCEIIYQRFVCHPDTVNFFSFRYFPTSFSVVRGCNLTPTWATNCDVSYQKINLHQKAVTGPSKYWAKTVNSYGIFLFFLKHFQEFQASFSHFVWNEFSLVWTKVQGPHQTTMWAALQLPDCFSL